MAFPEQPVIPFLRFLLLIDCGLGRLRTDVSLLGHLAACHQYRHDDRHISDGLPHSEQPESRGRGDSGQARRAHPLKRGAERVHRIEHLTQEEVDAFRERCTQAARRAAGDRAVNKANKAAKKAADKASEKA
jgi:hypothetical protein